MAVVFQRIFPRRPRRPRSRWTVLCHFRKGQYLRSKAAIGAAVFLHRIPDRSAPSPKYRSAQENLHKTG